MMKLPLFLSTAIAGIAILFSTCCLAAQGLDDYADKRKKVALTVGIAKYKNAEVLSNPIHDAEAVAQRLGEVGFSIYSAENVGVTDARLRIDSLERASDSDIALVYYSGHGLQINGENYLVPSDFDPSNVKIEDQLISITQLLAQLTEKSKAVVILLDACRNSPFIDAIVEGRRAKSLTRGFAPVKVEMPKLSGASGAFGLIVGYATQPNNTAADGGGVLSPYAAALIEATSSADEDLSSILVKAARIVAAETNGSQRPEHRVALTKPLYLLARPKPLQCDLLAAETDNNISLKGVEFDKIDVNAAIPACQADLSREPDNKRLIHNLARALDKAGRKVEAVTLYERAARLDFDWSQNNLSIMYFHGEGVEPDFAKAMRWMRRAFALGNRQAAVNYTDTDMSVLFEDNPARATQLQRSLISNGFLVDPPTAALDFGTQEALKHFKEKNGLRGTGITLQDMDVLGITDQVLIRGIH